MSESVAIIEASWPPQAQIAAAARAGPASLDLILHSPSHTGVDFALRWIPRAISVSIFIHFESQWNSLLDKLETARAPALRTLVVGMESGTCSVDPWMAHTLRATWVPALVVLELESIEVAEFPALPTLRRVRLVDVTCTPPSLHYIWNSTPRNAGLPPLTRTAFPNLRSLELIGEHTDISAIFDLLRNPQSHLHISAHGEPSWLWAPGAPDPILARAREFCAGAAFPRGRIEATPAGARTIFEAQGSPALFYSCTHSAYGEDPLLPHARVLEVRCAGNEALGEALDPAYIDLARLTGVDELIITGALLSSAGADKCADALGAWIMRRAQPLERITLDGCCDRSGVFDRLVDKRAARDIVGTNWR